MKNQKKPNVPKKKIAEIRITAYNDDSFNLNGPIDNPLLCQDLLNKAERLVINMLFKKFMDQQNKRIVIPNVIAPN